MIYWIIIENGYIILGLIVLEGYEIFKIKVEYRF